MLVLFVACYSFLPPTSPSKSPLSPPSSPMGAAAPSSLHLSLDTSLRSLPLSSFRRSLPLSISSARCAPGVIAASSSAPASSGGVFLDALGICRLQLLDKYVRRADLKGGLLEIRPMEDSEVDPTVQLLAESFAEAMGMSPSYVQLLDFLVRQYVESRRFLVPHAAMLVGFYSRDDKEPELVGTVEVSFDSRGANAALPTPLPPRDCPYICNMAVKKKFRRRGIGFQLLKACEELISQMKTDSKVYLHCRVTDAGPLKMYKKAGYRVIKTDSIRVWLTLQRRKNLLVKELRVKRDPPSDGEIEAMVVDNHASL